MYIFCISIYLNRVYCENLIWTFEKLLLLLNFLVDFMGIVAIFSGVISNNIPLKIHIGIILIVANVFKHSMFAYK